MKRRICIILSVIIISIFALLGWKKLLYMPQTDEQRIEEIFGIDKEKYPYEVLSARDTLAYTEYIGAYEAEVLMEEKYLPELLEMIKEKYTWSFSSAKELEGTDDVIIKNSLNYFLQMDSPCRMASFKYGLSRKIKFYPAQHRTKHEPNNRIICFPAENGTCRIIMKYVE